MNFLNAIALTGSASARAVTDASRLGTDIPSDFPVLGTLAPEPDEGFDRFQLGQRAAGLVDQGVIDAALSAGADPELLARIQGRAAEVANLQAQLATASGDDVEAGGGAAPEALEQLRVRQDAATVSLAQDLVAQAENRASGVRSSLATRYGSAVNDAANLFTMTADEVRKLPESAEAAKQHALRASASIVAKVAEVDLLKARYDAAVLSGDAGKAEAIATEYRKAYLETKELVDAVEEVEAATAQVQRGELSPEEAAAQLDEPGGETADGVLRAVGGQAPGFAAGDAIERNVDDVRDQATDEQIVEAQTVITEEVTTGRSRTFDEEMLPRITDIFLAAHSIVFAALDRMFEAEREYQAEQEILDEAAAVKRHNAQRVDDKIAQRQAEWRADTEAREIQRAAEDRAWRNS